MPALEERNTCIIEGWYSPISVCYKTDVSNDIGTVADTKHLLECGPGRLVPSAWIEGAEPPGVRVRGHV